LIAARLDHAWRVMDEARAAIPDAPSRHARRVWVDSITHAPRALGLVLDTFGADKVVLGSDYPFAPEAEDLRAAPILPPDVERRLTRDNALAFLGLPRGSQGSRRPSRGPPEREAGDLEVPVEGEGVAAPRRLHDGEADRIGIRDWTGRQPLQPAARSRVILGGREVAAHAGAGLDTLEGEPGRPRPKAEEDQAVHLRKDQIRREERHLTPESSAEQPLGIGVVLVAPAEERDPGAAIDEQPGGSAADVCGRAPDARQRRSRPDTGRSSR
jgi:hypothetical protein